MEAVHEMTHEGAREAVYAGWHEYKILYNVKGEITGGVYISHAPNIDRALYSASWHLNDTYPPKHVDDFPWEIVSVVKEH